VSFLTQEAERLLRETKDETNLRVRLEEQFKALGEDYNLL
jgi:ADP-ribose pyrophosphatase YjhB (NUDIX family)